MVCSNNKLADGHVLSDSNGIHTSLPLGFFIERYSSSYIMILRKFINCLLEKRQMPNDSEDGLNAIAIAEAAKKSIEENRVIRLKEFLD